MSVRKLPYQMIPTVMFCFLVVACKSLTSPLPSSTPTMIQEIITPTQELFPSATPSSTPVSPPTGTPSLTPTPTITLTPLPTLPSDEAQELVLTLMETNGGCKLPCWWGWIVPGQTSWEEADRFLQTFASKIRLVGRKGNVFLYDAYFVVPKTVRVEETLLVAIDVRDGIIEQILIGQDYPLNNLLIDYGIPTEIWVFVSDESFEEFSSEGNFTIALFWDTKGILAVYDGIAAKSDPLQICMDKLEKPAPALWLWDPSRLRTFKDVGGDMLFGPLPFQREFYQLEKATNMDVDTFYQAYVDPNNLSSCFEMPNPYSP